MRKVFGFITAGFAVLILSGCNPVGDISKATVYLDELGNGYKISGSDTVIHKEVDLCFYGDDYTYGRGSKYFDGTYSIDYSDIVFRDHTDGGSYRLLTTGEITEGYTYNFKGLNNNIKVEKITRSYNVQDCVYVNGSQRKLSSLKLMSKH